MSRKFIKQFSPDEVIIYLGYDWTEMNRFEKAQRAWLPYRIECPLIEKPYLDKEDMKRMIEEIEGRATPRLRRNLQSQNRHENQRRARVSSAVPANQA